MAPKVQTINKCVETDLMQKNLLSSYAIMAAVVFSALFLKLVAPAFAGLLVFILTKKLSNNRLTRRYPRHARKARAVALAFVFLAVLATITALGAATVHFVDSKDGLSKLFGMMTDTLEKIRISAPPFISDYLPASLDDAQASLVEMLTQHSDKISAVGMETLATCALILLALIAGGLVAWCEFAPAEKYRSLSRELLQRFTGLTQSFEKVVFAQVKISLLNTTLTAIYLLAALPLFHWYVPLRKTVVLITFVCGLLPVIGNLISNTIIVVLSMGVMPELGLISLGFLVGIHKLEYLLNARIIGHTIQSSAWELIISMIVLERAFGLAGLVAAPVLYAYIKHELSSRQLIGQLPPP